MKERNSAFEIMRIIAMYMVVLGHCMMVTAQDSEPILGKLDCLGWGIKAFTVCAVNLFFLLTGYFLNSSNSKTGRIIIIWLKTIFYSTAIYAIISFVCSDFKITDFIGYLFPVLLKKYWYMQTYIAVALVAPFIATGLENLDTKRITHLVLILLCFFCFHETFIKVSITLDQTQGYGFIWACVMLVVGFWCRKLREYIVQIPKVCYLIGYFLISLAIFASNYLIVKWNIARGITSRGNFYAYNSITVFLQSVCLFCFFICFSQKEKHYRIVNKLSQNVLSCYLISSHPLLMGSVWTDWFRMDQYKDQTGFFLVLSFAYTGVIMAVCIMIDKIIDYIFVRGSSIKGDQL